MKSSIPLCNGADLVAVFSDTVLQIAYSRVSWREFTKAMAIRVLTSQVAFSRGFVLFGNVHSGAHLHLRCIAWLAKAHLFRNRETLLQQNNRKSGQEIYRSTF